MTLKVTEEIKQAIVSILQYALYDEQKDFESYREPPENHIYHSLDLVNKWISSQESPLREVINEADAEMELASPHVTRAKELLTEALGVDPDIPVLERDLENADRDDALILLRNVWQAELHTSDRHGT